MRIPSYDDLTPSIPDIAHGDVLTSVAALLPGGGPVASRATETAAITDHLFASLHCGTSGSADLMPIARDFSPRVERHPGGTVVLDVAGLQRLFGDAAAIAEQLSNAGASSVAVASSQTAAILLSRARPGVTVAIGHPETALRDLPLAVLEQWLADADAAAPARASQRQSAIRRSRSFDVLRRWGLSTIGEYAALPADELSARLGSEGVAMQRLARGLDPRPLVPDPGIPRFIGTMELEWPIEMLEPLSFVFARLLDPLADALERADRGAAALRLELRLTDRTTHVRSLPLPAPMRDPRVLRTLLVLDLESHPPSAAVDVVSIEIDPAPGRVVQYSLLERAVPSPETLATLMARLGALVGEARCGSPVLLDVHRPDAFAMAPPMFDETRRIKLTPRPSEAPAAVLRRFRPPVAVRVLVEGGRPVRVAIDRRGMPGGNVLQAAGPWRTSGGWWERDRWNRDEWDVALSDSAICRLFRDRDDGGWFVEGIFD
jgi:protein ImuB